MAELLRDNQIAVLLVVVLLAALFGLRMRRRGAAGQARDPRMEGRARPPRYSHRAEGPPEDQKEDKTPDARDRELRRVRLQMIFALIAIMGFTLIALVNTFRGVSDLSP